MAVERDEKNIVTDLYGLDDGLVETAQTLFFDGIISAEIISLKRNKSIEEVYGLNKDFNYYDFSGELPIVEIVSNGKPLVCDFGSDSLAEINLKLASIVRSNPALSIYDFIASCVYYPALLLGKEAELKLNRQTELLLWERVDLVNKLLTGVTQVRKV
jgi:hypothetical protein